MHGFSQSLLEETGEPDSERSGPRKKSLESLQSFLQLIGLESQFPVLVKAGFDDQISLVEQMLTPVPLSDAMLREIGIAKSGHRKRLLLALHREAFGSTDSPASAKGFCCPATVTRSPQTDLKAWLQTLRLVRWHKNFVEAGYEDLQLIRDLMASPYPLTEAVLTEEVGIHKPGHRYRILGKLLDDAPQQAYRPKIPAQCEACLLI